MYCRNTTQTSLASECNVGCGCTAGSYEPICGNDGRQYFSPCYAGCQLSSKDNNSKVCLMWLNKVIH